jgi:hypothetical protein
MERASSEALRLAAGEVGPAAGNGNGGAAHPKP